MRSRVCVAALACMAVALTTVDSLSQTHPRQRPAASHGPRRPQATALVRNEAKPAPQAERPALRAEAPRQSPTHVGLPPLPVGNLTTEITLADIGFADGIRFANLGGRRVVFVPVPQVAQVTVRELVIVIDDISAHEARRSLEILVNDRSAAAIALDGDHIGRIVRIPLTSAAVRNGFLKIAFVYSGASTPDRCIDLRYVGDSVMIRPETGVSVGVDANHGSPDLATLAALLPREATIVMPNRRLSESDVAGALTIARALAFSGHRVGFTFGYEALPFLAKRNDQHWGRGIVVLGTPDEVSAQIDPRRIRVAGPATGFGILASVQISGTPALLVSDDNYARAAQLLGRPALAATRSMDAATVGASAQVALPTDRVKLEQLGLVLPEAAVYGRADLKVIVDGRTLPARTQSSRLIIDVMVAPDGTTERAVVSIYVNEQLLASSVAAVGEPTHFDLTLPKGLVGINANIDAVVQRRSAQGDCRFEPQGYPAQMLGSSSVVLTEATSPAVDFHDLAPLWANGVEVLVPRSAADRGSQVLALLARVLTALTPESATVTVKFIDPATAPTPSGPFIAVSNREPAGSSPDVHFDRGRVVVTDRAGRSLLDLGGFTGGAVAQVLTSNSNSGLWIKPLAPDGALPTPAALRLDRGNVAFVDNNGLALAMSTEHDTLVRISYPDQVSWLTVADRFRAWIVGALWVLATFGFLFALQRILRRRAKASSE